MLTQQAITRAFALAAGVTALALGVVFVVPPLAGVGAVSLATVGLVGVE